MAEGVLHDAVQDHQGDVFKDLQMWVLGDEFLPFVLEWGIKTIIMHISIYS